MRESVAQLPDLKAPAKPVVAPRAPQQLARDLAELEQRVAARDFAAPGRFEALRAALPASVAVADAEAVSAALARFDYTAASAPLARQRAALEG